MSEGPELAPRSTVVLRLSGKFLTSTVAALPGVALIALDCLVVVGALGSGLWGSVAAYQLLKEDGFLLPAAAFVSLGVALQLLLRFGGSIAGFAQRLWRRVGNTWRDARRAWRESLSPGRGERLE